MAEPDADVPAVDLPEGINKICKIIGLKNVLI